MKLRTSIDKGHTHTVLAPSAGRRRSVVTSLDKGHVHRVSFPASGKPVLLTTTRDKGHNHSVDVPSRAVSEMGSFPAMQTVFPPEHGSIFGYTYQGVPNPLVPHKHPYPTRYHGPNYTVPDSRSTYRERPYAESPYMGFDGTAPIFQHASGYAFVDAALGAGIGWVMSSPEDAPMFVFLGGLAGYFAGTAGLFGTAAIGLATRNKK